MKARTPIAVAAAAFLLAGISAASAGGMQSSGATAPAAKDTLKLSSAHQKIAWRNLSALKQTAPPNFNVAVGAMVPRSVTTATPVIEKAARDVPALKPYNFAMLQKKLVIVNPSDLRSPR